MSELPVSYSESVRIFQRTLASFLEGLVKSLLPDPVEEVKPGQYQRGLMELQALIELARINSEPLELTLDDSDLYDVFLCQPETYVQSVSTIQGVVMGRYADVEVHMSFREEDRPSYEGL